MQRGDFSEDGGWKHPKTWLESYPPNRSCLGGPVREQPFCQVDLRLGVGKRGGEGWMRVVLGGGGGCRCFMLWAWMLD